MSTLLRIPASEAHVVRVFAVQDKPDARLSDEAVLDALGAKGELETGKVELFDVAELQAMNLSDYLFEGHGISRAELEPMRGQLDTLKGRVLVLPSLAIRTKPIEMNVGAALRLIGHFTEEVPPVSFERLPDAAARGTLSVEGDMHPRRHRAARLLAFGFFAIAAVTVALVIGLMVRL